nr:cation-transporting P-type ATPase [Lebetimonas sp. JH292]
MAIPVNEVKNLSVDEVAKKFETDLQKGLSEEEAKKRLKQYG